MAKRISDGLAIDYTPGSAVSSGDIVEVGSLLGMAMLDIAADVKGAIGIQGVFEVPKDSSTFAQGDKVYWTGTAATSTASGNTIMGLAAAAAATGVATVEVILNVATS